MFAYCVNNPVNLYDNLGTFPVTTEIITRVESWVRKVVSTIVNSYKKYIQENHKGKPAVDENGNSYIDMTEDFHEFCSDCRKEMREYAEQHWTISTYFHFYEHVDHGGDWDIKRNPFWKFEGGKTYKLLGYELRNDDLGNILYGYVGSDYFPEVVLYFGAGYANGFEGPAYGDDPHDIDMIKFGILLADAWGN